VDARKRFKVKLFFIQKKNEITTHFSNKIFQFCSQKISFINIEKFLFYFHFFLHIHISFFEVIFNFINYGHLVDIHSEFFIDHQITYSNKKTKMIYNFDDNFINHPWKKSFGIVKWTENSQGESCVPDLFKIDNIAIEILESGKISFILNNLKQAKNKHFKEEVTVTKFLLEDVLKETLEYITKLTTDISMDLDSDLSSSNNNILFNFAKIVNDTKTMGLTELNKLNEEIKSIVNLN
jgi:hypothetical protein